MRLLFIFFLFPLFLNAQLFSAHTAKAVHIPGESAAQRVTTRYCAATGQTNYGLYIRKNLVKELEENDLYDLFHAFYIGADYADGFWINLINPEPYSGAFRATVHAGAVSVVDGGLEISSVDTLKTWFKPQLCRNWPNIGALTYTSTPVDKQIILGHPAPFNIENRFGGKAFVSIGASSTGVDVGATPAGLIIGQRSDANTVDFYQGTTRYSMELAFASSTPFDYVKIIGNSTATYNLRILAFFDKLTDAQVVILKGILDRFIYHLDNPNSTNLISYTAPESQAAIVKAMQTSENQFTVGVADMLDDGRGISWGDSNSNIGGTDNFATFNQESLTADKGVTWTYAANAPWSDRNAMGVANVGLNPNRPVMWGGRNQAGTNFVDSWERNAGTWTQISASMTGFSNTRSQFAYARTLTRYLTLFGFNANNVIGSTDLQSWSVIGTGPDSLQTCGTGTAWYDSIDNAVYHAGGFNTTLNNYVNKLYRSTDEGATFQSIITGDPFGDQWSNAVCLNWGVILVRGFQGVNQKGTYLWRRGTDITNINNWVRLPYELPARHATPLWRKWDKSEAYAVMGNFFNDSWLIKRIDQ